MFLLKLETNDAIIADESSMWFWKTVGDESASQEDQFVRREKRQSERWFKEGVQREVRPKKMLHRTSIQRGAGLLGV